MITKLGIMVINLEGLLPVKLLNTFFTWSCKIIRQTKANYQSAYDTKLMVTYLKHLLLDYAVSQDQATNLKHNISTPTMSIDPKLDKVVNYF